MNKNASFQMPQIMHSTDWHLASFGLQTVLFIIAKPDVKEKKLNTYD